MSENIADVLVNIGGGEWDEEEVDLDEEEVEEPTLSEEPIEEPKSDKEEAAPVAQSNPLPPISQNDYLLNMNRNMEEALAPLVAQGIDENVLKQVAQNITAANLAAQMPIAQAQSQMQYQMFLATPEGAAFAKMQREVPSLTPRTFMEMQKSKLMHVERPTSSPKAKEEARVTKQVEALSNLWQVDPKEVAKRLNKKRGVK